MSHATTCSALVAALCSVCTPAIAQPTAEYRVTLDATWSAESHPGAFPAQAHFSPFIGAMHNDAYTLWEPGTLASNGVEDMAETGRTSLLAVEIIGATGQGNATDTLRGPFLNAGQAGGDTFVAQDTHSLLSLVSMIAPSPDWFVGVHGLDLQQDGEWVDYIEIELFAYDSGTDSGPNFNSSNSDTQPPAPIEDFSTTAPFAGTPHVAVLIIERTDVPCPADVNDDGDATPADFTAWLACFNNPTSAPFCDRADVNNSGAVDPADFTAWLAAFNAGCD